MGFDEEWKKLALMLMEEERNGTGTPEAIRLLAELEKIADTPETQHVVNELCARHGLKRDNAANETNDKQPNKIRLHRGSDLLTPTPIKWLVSGVLEAGVLAAAFGAPASGKSFVAIDLALSIASGRAWNDRGVKQGSVVYFAGEGKAGIKRRLTAWMQRNPESRELIAEHFYLSDRACNLPNETALVLDTLADVKNLKLVILDTLQRTMEGDENSTRDMTAYIKSLDAIKAAHPESVVLVVHHTGHGSADRARGSSVLKASLDAEISVSKDDAGVITLKSSKAKDAEPFPPLSFRLESVVLDGWADETGQPVTSAVLKHLEAHQQELSWLSKVNGKNQKAAMIVLETLYQAQRRNLEANGHDPSGAQVTLDDWITDCVAQGITKRPAYFRRDVLAVLVEKGAVNRPNGGMYVQIVRENPGEGA